MKLNRLSFAAGVAALSLAFSAAAQTPAPKPADTSKSATKKSSAPMQAPTDAQIADAKAQGKVWVNTNTRVYHSGGEFYGKTKSGKFMTEDEAKQAGYKAAKEPAAKKSAKK